MSFTPALYGYPEARLEAVHLGLPGEVEGVDRDAVAAEARARVEGHEAEGLRLGGVDDLPDVDAERVRHERDLVHQPDVDAAERVLEELDHLSDAGRGHRDHPLDALGVERRRRLRARGRDAPHDLRDVA